MAIVPIPSCQLWAELSEACRERERLEAARGPLDDSWSKLTRHFDPARVFLHNESVPAGRKRAQTHRRTVATFDNSRWLRGPGGKRVQCRGVKCGPGVGY